MDTSDTQMGNQVFSKMESKAHNVDSAFQQQPMHAKVKVITSCTPHDASHSTQAQIDAMQTDSHITGSSIQFRQLYVLNPSDVRREATGMQTLSSQVDPLGMTAQISSDGEGPSRMTSEFSERINETDQNILAEACSTSLALLDMAQSLMADNPAVISDYTPLKEITHRLQEAITAAEMIVAQECYTRPVSPYSVPHTSQYVPPNCQDFYEDVVIGESVIPSDVASSAVRGNFANLSYFVPQPWHFGEEEYEFDVTTMTMKPILPAIASYDEWLVAWYAYEELLVQYCAEPDMYAKCCSYRRLIHKCQQTYIWPAVYSFDIQFRTQLSKAHSLDFENVHLPTFYHTMNAATIRKDLCDTCSQVHNSSNECPFRQAPPSKGAKKDYAKKKQAHKSQRRKKSARLANTDPQQETNCGPTKQSRQLSKQHKQIISSSACPPPGRQSQAQQLHSSKDRPCVQPGHKAQPLSSSKNRPCAQPGDQAQQLNYSDSTCFEPGRQAQQRSSNRARPCLEPGRQSQQLSRNNSSSCPQLYNQDQQLNITGTSPQPGNVTYLSTICPQLGRTNQQCTIYKSSTVWASKLFKEARGVATANRSM